MREQKDKYNNPTLEAHNTSYLIPEAALLWCNVPKEKVLEVLKQSTLLFPRNESDGEFVGEIWMNFEVPCLKNATETITDALAQGELPCVFDTSIPKADDGGYKFSVRHRILRRDFKKWMGKAFPDEKPAFLFDDSEREACAVNTNVYQELKKEKDDLEIQLGEGAEIINVLKEENESIKAERDSLKKEIDQAGVPSERSKITYQNLIAVLLRYIKGEIPGIDSHPSFVNESKLIGTIVENFPDTDGLSLRNLQRKFPEANRSLGSQ